MTLGLLVSINLLSSHRTLATEQRPLLVVKLTMWPEPVKQKKQTLTSEPKPEQQPATKKIIEKKPLPPSVQERIPMVKKQPLETKKPIQMEEVEADAKESVDEISIPSIPLIATKNEEGTMPTPVPIFQITQVPRFLHRKTPVYPEEMRSQGISGMVKLEVLIDKDGQVRQVSILKSAGKYFDEAARQAILASTFYPAKVDSESVAVLLRLPVKFGLY